MLIKTKGEIMSIRFDIPIWEQIFGTKDEGKKETKKPDSESVPEKEKEKDEPTIILRR